MILSLDPPESPGNNLGEMEKQTLGIAGGQGRKATLTEAVAKAGESRENSVPVGTGCSELARGRRTRCHFKMI